MLPPAVYVSIEPFPSIEVKLVLFSPDVPTPFESKTDRFRGAWFLDGIWQFRYSLFSPKPIVKWNRKRYRIQASSGTLPANSGRNGYLLFDYTNAVANKGIHARVIPSPFCSEIVLQ